MSVSSVILGRKLLSGDVICQWTEPQAFAELLDLTVREAYNERFAFLGAKLALNELGTGFFLVMLPDSADLEKKSYETFSLIMRTIRPTIDWLNFLMSTLHPDHVICGGEDLLLSDILSKLSSNAALRDALDKVGRLKGVKVKEKVESLIALLKKEGVLIEIDSQNDRYRFTGKMDLINEFLLFIADNEAIHIDDEGEAEQQGQLL